MQWKRIAALILSLGLGAVVLHDLGAETCSRWYRLPLQVGCDLALPDSPFGHPLFEVAYGASAPQLMHGFILSDPWSYRDPRDGRESTWTDLQSGTFTVVEPLNLVIVMPPPWLDESEFLGTFSALNPNAAPLSESSKPPPFALIQTGGGVEGLGLQILLEESGRVRAWARRGRRTDDSEKLHLIHEADLSRTEALQALHSAFDQPASESARVYWNCRMLDGGARSLTTFDGHRLQRSHWINNRWPPESSQEVLETLLEVGVPDEEGASL